MCSVFRDDRGQSTIEAAYVIPILFLLLLLLIQPGIILYDRMVMQAAAAEGCRLLATSTDAVPDATSIAKEYVLRRLGSIPPHDCFHRHEGGCTWDVELTGDENSDYVSVRISNRIKPLPALDLAASLLNLTDEIGCLGVRVEVSMPSQPSWISDTETGRSPKQWIGAWVDGD